MYIILTRKLLTGRVWKTARQHKATVYLIIFDPFYPFLPQTKSFLFALWSSVRKPKLPKADTGLDNLDDTVWICMTYMRLHCYIVRGVTVCLTAPFMQPRTPPASPWFGPWRLLEMTIAPKATWKFFLRTPRYTLSSQTVADFSMYWNVLTFWMFRLRFLKHMWSPSCERSSNIYDVHRANSRKSAPGCSRAIGQHDMGRGGTHRSHQDHLFIFVQQCVTPRNCNCG